MVRTTDNENGSRKAPSMDCEPANDDQMVSGADDGPSGMLDLDALTFVDESGLSRVPKLVQLDGGCAGEVPGGLNRFAAAALSWLLLPIYVTVGPMVRARTLRMVPPPGPHGGHLPGAGKPVRLLVIGDSSAASVGVSHTRDGLAARISEAIHERTGRPVTYVAFGNNSAIAEDVRDHVVPHLPDEPFTHIIVSVGANDAKNFHSAKRWKKGFGTLLYALRTRYPEACIVWSRLFEFSKLPAVPRSLGWVLDLRRIVVCRIADELCVERGAHAAPFMPIRHPSGLSLDGFHASARGYRAWGNHLGAFIATLERPRRVVPGRAVPRVRPRVEPPVSLGEPALETAPTATAKAH